MDQTLLTFFNQTLAHPWLDWLMIVVTTGGLALLPALGITLLISPEQRRVGLAILVALLGGLSLALIFQQLTLRPRPELVRHLLATPGFPSFPSGHATAAFSAAAVLMLSYRRRSWQVTALLGAGLIALSRLYLGVHYPSDLVAGAILGTAAGVVAYGLLVAPAPGQPRNWGWLLWLQVAVALVVTQMAYLDFLPWWLLRWPLADKVMHFLLVGSIAFWLNLWLAGRTVPLWRWSLPVAFLLPFTLAALEEGAQTFSPLRTADLTDLLSDVLGLLVFLWLSRRLLQFDSSTKTDYI